MWLRKQDDSRVFWGYRDLLVFVGLAIVCLIGGALLVKGLLLLLFVNNPHKALELLLGQFLGYALLYSALAFLFRFEYEQPFWQSLGWRRPRLPLPTILMLGGILALSIGILGALLHTPDVPTPMKDLLSDRVSLVVVAILGVTAGPMCEELAFRGLMQPLFIQTLGVPAGVFLSGFGFGLLHLPQYGYTWQHGILITLAGVCFGWMRQVSRSTLGSTLMHCAYNLTLFLGIFAAGDKAPRSW